MHVTGFDNSTIVDGKRVAVWLAHDGWRWFVEREGWDNSKQPESDGPFPSERAALANALDVLKAA